MDVILPLLVEEFLPLLAVILPSLVDVTPPLLWMCNFLFW